MKPIHNEIFYDPDIGIDSTIVDSLIRLSGQLNWLDDFYHATMDQIDDIVRITYVARSSVLRLEYYEDIR